MRSAPAQTTEHDAVSACPNHRTRPATNPRHTNTTDITDQRKGPPRTTADPHPTHSDPKREESVKRLQRGVNHHLSRSSAFPALRYWALRIGLVLWTARLSLHRFEAVDFRKFRCRCRGLWGAPHSGCPIARGDPLGFQVPLADVGAECGDLLLQPGPAAGIAASGRKPLKCLGDLRVLTHSRLPQPYRGPRRPPETTETAGCENNSTVPVSRPQDCSSNPCRVTDRKKQLRLQAGSIISQETPPSHQEFRR